MPTRLSRRFSILLAISLGGMALFGLAALALVAQTGIDGVFWRQISDDQDLIGDIEPPPLYLVEAMMIAQQLARVADPAPGLARFAALEERYAASAAAWRKRFADRQGPERQALAGLEESARAFLAVTHGGVLPALARGDRAGAGALVDGPLAAAFASHRAQVERLLAELASQRRATTARAHLVEAAIGCGMAALLLALLAAARGLHQVRAGHQRELHEREARFRALAEAAFEGIVMSERGALVDANAQFLDLLGHATLAPLRGRMLSELIAPECRSDFLNRIVAEDDHDYEVALLRADGAVIHAEVRLRYYVLGGRRLRIAAVRDASQRKRAERELLGYRDHLEELVAERTRELERERSDADGLRREAEGAHARALAALAEAQRLEASYLRARDEAEAANRAKSDFLASMSHEIRTPLNAVLGYAQMLVRARGLDEDQRRAVAVINRSGEHLLALISDILDMSRIEAGGAAASPEDFDLHDLLDSLRSLFLLRARDKRLELRVTLAADLPRYVRSDQRMLRQILVNLLANAVKFTASGAVEVRAACAAGRLGISVRDSGRGIADADLARLFQPFVQVGGGRARSEGSGLGLAISRGLARALGGDLTATSVAGRGSDFALDIPVAAAARAAHAPPSGRQIVGLAPGSPAARVLIVEDHPDNQRLLLELFAGAGLEVRAVGDGAAAVAATREWAPQVIWMDLDLPGLDGLQATRAIRALPGAQPRIIALTAAAFAEDRERLLAGGCDGLVHKPYREEDLFRALEDHVGVRFTWHEPGRLEGDPVVEDGLADGIAALPAADRQALRAAVVTGDLGAIATVTARLADRGLARAIDRLAEGFAIERLELLTAAAQPPAVAP